MPTSAPAADRRSVYASVTDRIVAALEKGVAPWVCPWNTSGGKPRNGTSGHIYRGINVILTGMSGHGDPRWFTYKQAQAAGGNVRRGEKGTPVVYWQFVDRQSAAGGEQDNGDRHPQRAGRVPFARTYTVFNADQIEWAPTSKFAAEPEPVDSELHRRRERDPRGGDELIHHVAAETGRTRGPQAERGSRGATRVDGEQPYATRRAIRPRCGDTGAWTTHRVAPGARR